MHTCQILAPGFGCDDASTLFARVGRLLDAYEALAADESDDLVELFQALEHLDTFLFFTQYPFYLPFFYFSFFFLSNVATNSSSSFFFLLYAI